MSASATQATSPLAVRAHLLGISFGVVLQQALYAAARLGIADLLVDGPKPARRLAFQLKLDESALARVLRLLASRGIFEELPGGDFVNNAFSEPLRSDVPESIRCVLIFRGSEFFYAPFEHILYSLETGLPAREKLYGKNAFDHLKVSPEDAKIFDDAMSNMSALIGPVLAGAYDFGAWGSLMDVGGGNGAFLAAILRQHSKLQGTLADLPHVLDHVAEDLKGDLAPRTHLAPCDFFEEVPTGSRAYVLKFVIHDWDDDRARKILANCHKAVPADGVLLLVEYSLPEGSRPSLGRFTDIAMLVLTGGRERTIEEHRALLADSGFNLQNAIPVPGDLVILEAAPV
jgi:hypothetical protein